MLFADACGRIQFSWNVLDMSKNYCTRIFFLLVKNAKALSYFILATVKGSFFKSI